MKDLKLAIEGMSCGHCLDEVKLTLQRLPGVEVDLVRMGRAELRYDEGAVSVDQITAAIRVAGYSGTPFASRAQS